MKLLYYLPILLCLAYTARGEEIEKDTAKIRNVELNEVIVQSFKQQRDLRLEPLSASAVTGTAIQNRNITGIKEFSSFIPNLFMPDYGSKLTSPVYIRGIGSKINAPSVGLYVDGIPYFEKSAFDFDFNEVDRIEVLRGPQGTLYGRNTMGGIINVYTKSPFGNTRGQMSGFPTVATVTAIMPSLIIKRSEKSSDMPSPVITGTATATSPTCLQTRKRTT